MNQPSTKVEKALGPEEQALLANIGALVQELQSGASAGAAPAAEPDGDEGLNAPGVIKGSEQGNTPAEPQSAMQPGAAPKEKGMAPWQDNDDVQKGFKMIAKALMSSPTEGPEAQLPGDKRLEEMPDEADENINEVAKALAKAFASSLGRRPVAKSLGSVQAPQSADLTAALAPLMTVMKSMSDRITQQGQIIGEMLEGLGAVPPAPEAQPQGSVRKSGGNMPYAGLDAGSLELVVASVAKGLAGTFRQSDGVPVAKGFGGPSEDRPIEGFTEEFVTATGWGQ
jgi:hypothetical protein